MKQFELVNRNVKFIFMEMDNDDWKEELWTLEKGKDDNEDWWLSHIVYTMPEHMVYRLMERLKEIGFKEG